MRPDRPIRPRAALLAARTAAAAVVAAAAIAVLPRASAGEDPGAGLVVHEWGTFTSMQGSDGLVLEGLNRSEEALPSFVYSRDEVRDCPLRAQGWKGLEVPPDRVTQKLETPVLYFHSDRRRRVEVRVDFVRGLLTQWYPVVDLLGPPEGARDAGPLDVSKVERSFLQWDVDVLAPGDGRPSEVPDAPDDDPWTFAREVDANWLRTEPRTEPGRAGPVEAERYLFYRGLGAFRSGLSAQVARDGKVTLSNGWAGKGRGIGAVIVTEIRGDRGRVTVSDPVAPKGTATAQLRDGEWWGPIDDVEEKLKAFLSQRLGQEGLREDEARAMVRTWARSWFRSEGLRALWIVPAPVVDEVLPLRITPKPERVVRVLVGRTELVSPQVEDEVTQAVRDRFVADEAVRDAAAARLARLDRFLEPHLRNVLAKAADETTRANAQRLLVELGASGEEVRGGPMTGAGVLEVPSSRVNRTVPEAKLRPSAADDAADDVAPLVALARDGGPHAGTAFAEIHRRFVRVVHGIALARVAPDDADDVVQEVFVRVHRTLGSLRDAQAFPAWICTLARNVATDHARAAGRRPPTEPVPAGRAAAPAQRSDDELRAAVLRCLGTLPEAYRETLLLRLAEGLTGPEIAERTGLTAESVRVNLSRGMAKLRPLLEKEGWR